jgi:hypothetical protein
MEKKEYVLTIAFVFIAGLIGGFMLGGGHEHAAADHQDDVPAPVHVLPHDAGDDHGTDDSDQLPH